MTAAFQADAFQNDAFQVDGDAVVEGPPPYPTVAVLGESAGVSFRRQPATPVAVLDEPRNEVKL